MRFRRPQNIVDGSVAAKLRNRLDGSVATMYLKTHRISANKNKRIVDPELQYWVKVQYNTATTLSKTTVIF